MPTIADLTGSPLPSDRENDRVSMVPALLGQPGPRREWIFSDLADLRLLRDHSWLLKGDGRFYDGGDRRDGDGCQDVTDSDDPAVRTARERFERILEELPSPHSLARVSP